MNNPLSCLAAIAESQIGTCEDSCHTNRGAAIKKYQEATDLDGQGWPWCAAFVCWCVADFIAQFPSKVGLQYSERPQAASVLKFKDWSKRHGCLIFTDAHHARRGDIVTFEFSHIGIVCGNWLGELETIEGNTNPTGGRDGYMVAHRNRTREIDLVDWFIRLPARAEPA